MTDPVYSLLDPVGPWFDAKYAVHYTEDIVFETSGGSFWYRPTMSPRFQRFSVLSFKPYGPVMGLTDLLDYIENHRVRSVGLYRIPTEEDLKRIKLLGVGPVMQSMVPGSEPKEVESYDHVDKPPHYHLIAPCEKYPNGVELNDLIWEKPLNIGAAIKYLMRMGSKPGNSELQEIRKAHKHLSMEIDHRKERGDG